MLKSKTGWLFRDSEGSGTQGSSGGLQSVWRNGKHPGLMVTANLAWPIRLVAGLVSLQCWRFRRQRGWLHCPC